MNAKERKIEILGRISEKLVQLQSEVKRSFDAVDDGWEYTGDMEHLNTQLGEVVNIQLSVRDGTRFAPIDDKDMEFMVKMNPSAVFNGDKSIVAFSSGKQYIRNPHDVFDRSWKRWR